MAGLLAAAVRTRARDGAGGRKAGSPPASARANARAAAQLEHSDEISDSTFHFVTDDLLEVRVARRIEAEEHGGILSGKGVVHIDLLEVLIF